MSTPSSWDHGYSTATRYTCGFYRELAPAWLDFAALVKGLHPPREDTGAPFRYLELGSGMGLTLLLLAALHPEGDFLGVDFHPDHIAHAEDLRRRLGLSNVRFLEADFLSLAADPSALHATESISPGWSYVVAHGIATWVSPPVQQALLSLASSCLATGGLLYLSYNTLPGWLHGSVFHRHFQLERQRADPSDPMAAFHRAADTLRQLLGTEDQPTALARSLPHLDDHLRSFASQSPAYLTQEYVETWQPLYSAEMHERCRQHRLRHVGTATLPELLDDLLPAHLQALLRQEGNPTMRETLLDLATYRSFRRDLFCRGQLTLSRTEREEALHNLVLRTCEAPPQSSYSFTTSLGPVKANARPYRALEAALADGPHSIGELSVLCDRPLSEVLGMATLLLHAGRLGLDRGEATELARPVCRRVAHELQERNLQGHSYEYLPAPAIGSAVSFSLVEGLAARALADGLGGDVLISCVQLGLQQLNRRLNDADGRPYDDPEKEFEALQTLIERLLTHRLPALRALGLFEQS